MRLTCTIVVMLAGPVSSVLAQPEFVYHGPTATLVYDPADGEASAPVFVTIENTPSSPGFPNPISGFAIAMGYDGELIEITALEATGALADVNNGDGPEFFATGIDCFPGDGFKVSCVITLLQTEFLVLPAPTPIIELTVETIPGDFIGNPIGGAVGLDFCNDCQGDPFLVNVVITDTGQADLSFIDRFIFIVPIDAPFRRGDVDADGDFNGLTDALSLLEFQFTGGAEPPCLDAADADDDGVVNGIIDGLWILAFQYTGGPPPAPPGLSCGLDESFDELGCLSYPECP